MQKLQWHDLQFALRRTPRALLETMKLPCWHDKIFIGGGFLRSVVAGEPVNDVDVFCSSKWDALSLARALVTTRLKMKPEGELGLFSEEQEKTIKSRIHETDNAFTLLCYSPTIQIIHRWLFPAGSQVIGSFDFTVCAAAFWYGVIGEKTSREATDAEGWHSAVDDRFYPDLASKWLVYRNPVRNEDAGGSIDLSKCSWLKSEDDGIVTTRVDEKQFSKVICGLLREVDPNVDPNHIAHLPAENTEEPLDV